VVQWLAEHVFQYIAFMILPFLESWTWIPWYTIALLHVAGAIVGDAIGLGVGRLRAMPRDERVMVLLTDGSSTDGVMAVEDAARLARHHGVRVHAIGIGKPRTGQELRRGEGLDEPALQDVAAQTGGRYYRADDGSGLAGIYKEIDAQEPVAVDERVYRPTDEWYVWPLLAALLLALGAFAAGWREARA
jgi:Ca-activated chloride channel family protein